MSYCLPSLRPFVILRELATEESLKKYVPLPQASLQKNNKVGLLRIVPTPIRAIRTISENSWWSFPSLKSLSQ